MTTSVTTAAPAVTLPEVKLALGIEHGDKDADLERLVAVASERVSRRIGRALRPQTFDYRFKTDRTTSWPWWATRSIRLPYPPLISVDQVTYRDTVGATQTLQPSSYVADPIGDEWEASVRMADGATWPIQPYCERITVRFTAGYPDGPNGEITVPQPIRQAIMLLVGHYFANREAVSDKPMAALPMAVDDLCNDFRIYSF
ncbi:MAG TPA: head-tail connector protein [Microvirga sp.]|jgi:uncharacterized phiE125 gp8 family phage protein|nr:head-tail connector protein [Microvirga sp.]